ncbi:hypothetical protein CAC42_5293 [Sphaceloma murrayae]|uniref:Uncharacterized protein n=1 Tax=Sphaceloma murrayae TaxID=2082308 RepID=A0A2K1QUK9_9PEZI|nr:hypothetical protein CAC42_5293 [Sphaceloma murrayae]
MSEDPPSDTESFKSARSRSRSPPRSQDTSLRFSPSEEASLLQTSNAIKAEGNSLFARASFSDAISTYDRALASVPNYLDYEVAVLRSNIAACHIKLGEWKEAVESATKAAEGLEGLDHEVVQPDAGPKVRDGVKSHGSTVSDKQGLESGTERKGDGDREEHVRGSEKLDTDDLREKAIKRLQQSGHTLEEVRKLRAKVLMRRAKARTELGGWSALQGAEEDYRFLLANPGLSEMDERNAKGALAALGPRLDDARQREMAEMMGKLKGLGNSLLKPFGLSTENFNFVKDDKTGGYSMNFQQ